MNDDLRQMFSGEDFDRAASLKRKSSSTGGGKRKFRKKRRFSFVPAILIFLVLLIGGTVAGGFLLLDRGKKSFLEHHTIEGVAVTAPEEAVVEDKGFTVKYKGKTYARNENIISALIMGIDRSDFDEEGRVIGTNGQADTLVLAVLDTDSGKVTLLNISRDSMVDVDLYNVDDEYVDTEEMQICLAYSYGDGKDESCINTVKSVSRLFYGMPIDAYAAINLNAISVLNDALGGVEVEVLEDLTRIDPALQEGAQVLLLGQQAMSYVRSRESGEGAPVDANNARMARQKQYITRLLNKALHQIRRNPSVTLSLYQAMNEYMVTDVNAARATYLASLAVNGNFEAQNIRTVPGTVTMGEEYAEYHVDDEALYEIILDVFYTEV